MNRIESRNAVFARIDAMPDLPSIVWSGQSNPGELPRVEVNPGPTINETIGFDSYSSHMGEVQVIVVVPEGRLAVHQSDSIVRAIELAFPLHDRFGGIIIIEPVDVRPPIVEESEYRVAVFIRYKTIIG